LPGSTGWWLKRRIEDARLVIALDRSTEVRLQLDFARRRLNEVSELVARGDAPRATPALRDYQRRVQAVSEFLPNLAAATAKAGLHERIEADLEDYVAMLAEQGGAVCADGPEKPKDACGQIDSSSQRSRATLERVAGLPKRRGNHRPADKPVRAKKDASEEKPGGGAAASQATPVADPAPAGSTSTNQQKSGGGLLKKLLPG
jgi:hypothetical protein